jgi:hypothetical protein
MRKLVKAVLVFVGVALVVGAAAGTYAAQPSTLTLGDDSVPAGKHDEYEAVCNGQGFISGAVHADNNEDVFLICVRCTGGVPPSKGVENCATGVTAQASVGPKCEKVVISVFCASGACPPEQSCGGYTVSATCVDNPIQRMELTADDATGGAPAP